MRIRWALVAAIASAALSAPAQAIGTTSRIDADLGCLVSSLHLMQSSTPSEAQAGLASFLYWLGRVDGADPEIDLENRVAAIAQEMSQDALNAELVRCGTEMQTRGAEVQEIGNRLQARGL